MKGLVIGLGEVGQAHYEILAPVHPTWGRDLEEPKDKNFPKEFDILNICLRHSECFESIVYQYAVKYKPRYVNICSTVPPGTCKAISESLPTIFIVHSTTRGLHPNLTDGLRAHVKHIGGMGSDVVARYFQEAGLKVMSHTLAVTTELAHILNNAAYGMSLMFADEMAKICRLYGVDYYEAVMIYTATNNDGFRRLGQNTKVRTIVTPPNGKIGGHCVTQCAQLIPQEERKKIAPMLDMLAHYNDGGK